MFKCRDIGIVVFVSVNVSICVLSDMIHDSMFKRMLQCYSVAVNEFS